MLLLILSPALGISNPSKHTLDNLRPEYLTALSDYLMAPGVHKTFLQVENPSAKILTYQGALEAIMTKTTCHIFKKKSNFNKSEESLKKVTELAPNDVEMGIGKLTFQGVQKQRRKLKSISSQITFMK